MVSRLHPWRYVEVNDIFTYASCVVFLLILTAIFYVLIARVFITLSECDFLTSLQVIGLTEPYK